MVNEPRYTEFLKSDDTLRIYAGNTLVFSSKKDGLLPLLEYIERFAADYQDIIVFDRVVGNAVSLLAIKVGCREVYSPLGSRLAIQTLEKYGIKYHFDCVVSFIQRADGNGMCPMEKLSLDQAPEPFYTAVTARCKQ